MLIKEYRICLPLSVAEYRIAQLYMIQKKSREESSGSGSGVEILVNEPYSDGPGGAGQYTQKIYHIGSHLPGWFRAILPKSALIVEEEAWNAYPYTKTIYRCPFIEKFVLEIETVYHDDDGSQENVFNLSSTDLTSRTVDYMDIVTDPISSGDYRREEDPRLFCSEQTGRGPLSETWREDYARVIKENASGTCDRALMCAYKLCKVEFRYWGMQGKIERFIHDIGLRKTMLRAHRQAWCWQDEYYGLTMDDIRRLERETQLALQEKMTVTEESAVQASADGQHRTSLTPSKQPPRVASDSSFVSSGSRRLSFQSARSRATADSNIEKLRTSSSEEEDEYYDAEDMNGLEFSVKAGDYKDMIRSSSVEFLEHLDDECDSSQSSDTLGTSLDQRMTMFHQIQSISVDGSALMKTPVALTGMPHRVSVLFLLLHGGSILDTGLNEQQPSKNADLLTFSATLDNIMRSHYPSVCGSVAVKLVSCPNICSEALSLLGSFTPHRGESFNLESVVISENFPLTAVSLFTAAGPHYSHALAQVVSRANSVYSNFVTSDEGLGFSGQVCIVADAVGSLLGYDILCRTPDNSGSMCRHGSGATLVEAGYSDLSHSAANSREPADGCASRHPDPADSASDAVVDQFEFDVSEFFMLGSPVALVLAYRQLCGEHHYAGSTTMRPLCNQLYNIYYSSHPSAMRIEPLLHPSFKHIIPVMIPRYEKYPYGDSAPLYAMEAVQGHRDLFVETSSSPVSATANLRVNGDVPRRLSNQSSHSDASCNMDLSAASSFVRSHWWGIKRLDYSVYCPEALQNFPSTALPYLLHASVWESTDIIAFILRQVFRQELQFVEPDAPLSGMSTFRPSQPREKWLKRRTTIKLKNVSPNHRGNDVIVLEGRPQTLVGRFMYGPLDVVSLTGEKVDIYIMTNPSVGQWTFFDTEITDAAGRVSYRIADNRHLPEGMYPVKMVVRGDHTCCDFYLTVLPANTDAAVFSIDGSFTASVSIMGKDPKVQPGAVDVARHYDERGYLILYITARPDMQQRMVVSWLAQHNFPHGMLAFMDGLSAEPLRQKTNYLRQLVQEAQLNIRVAYGSSKDIAVYQAIGLQPDQIYIIGRVAKKHRKEAVVLTDGYAAHLDSLTLSENPIQPLGNLRLSQRKAGFSFPVHRATNVSHSRKSRVRKATSLPTRRQQLSVCSPTIAVTDEGNTVVGNEGAVDV